MNLETLRGLVGCISYRHWILEVDDAGAIWIRRINPDSADPANQREVLLTNVVVSFGGHVFLASGPASDAREVLDAIWAEIRRAEDHERLENLRCAHCGRTIFPTHLSPDTRPPAGSALVEPDYGAMHLCVLE